jgi:hypothetical protein
VDIKELPSNARMVTIIFLPIGTTRELTEVNRTQ